MSTLSKRITAAGMILAAGPLGGLWVPAAAHAATPNTVAIEPRKEAAWVKDVVVSTGDAKDQIRVSRAGDAFVVKGDTGLTAGTGCTAPTANEVRCPVAGIASVTVMTGAGDDVIVVEAPAPGGAIVGHTRLRGGPGRDLIFAGEGNDSIEGGLGNDFLWGNTGNDIFLAEAVDDGADHLEGGDGRDTASYRLRTAGVDVSIDGVDNDGTVGASEGDNLYFDVESVTGGRGADRLVGNEFDNHLRGDRGADVIEGLEGDDDLIGEQGDDRLDGGHGNDTIDDGDGRDTVLGGHGDDQVESSHFVRADPDAYDGGPGEDTLSYNTQRYPFVGVTVDFDGVADDGAPGENDSLTGFENLIGTEQDDVLTGDDENNFIDGGGGADRIDVVDGRNGNDFVRGGFGDDICRADPGDTLQECEAEARNRDASWGVGNG